MAVTKLEPETVNWVRDVAFEADLQRFGVKWRWETDVPFDKIFYDRNPSRLREKVDQARIDDLAYKIIEHGMNLPGLLLMESGGKFSCLGGFHRTGSSRDVGIKTCSAYVVTGIGPETAFELAIANNGSNVGGLTIEERIERAAEEASRLEEAGTPPDLTQMAFRLDIPVEKLVRKVSVGRFRVLMTQPDTLVLGSDKMPDAVVDVLSRNSKLVNEPVLIEAARCLARFKDTTVKAAEELIREIKKVQPKTESAQRTKITEMEHDFQRRLEIRKADKASSKGKQPATRTAATLILSDMSRAANTTKALDTANLFDLFQDEQRERFMAIAAELVERFQKAIKTLK